ncbi:hypothetical protein J7T55_007645 [Diaporthe amygdali]|uniref:uncharacterized protein n=1 Tax=Phomopsis amygdali TaxID=1214568 RepID=UPI0022FEF95B|nr:uncharacterized protein J7T55_007645 [Diaporthe amygdali]KAJ0107456.1 hypothetical protein J7T55_007645 [Diaporthe amygdali]
MPSRRQSLDLRDDSAVMSHPILEDDELEGEFEEGASEPVNIQNQTKVIEDQIRQFEKKCEWELATEDDETLFDGNQKPVE